MQIAIYAALMVVVVLVLLWIGNRLIDKGRHPAWIVMLAVGLIVIAVTVAYASQAVHLRKEVVAWR